LSLLFHRTLGPILTASMTDYQAIEISNQQAHRDYPHMTLTPRIECTTDVTYTSLSDFEASLAVTSSQSEISLDARGRLLTASYQPIPNGGVHYQLLYRLSPAKVEIVASADGKAPALLRFVLPVVSQHEELIEHPATNAVRIVKNKDRLVIRTDAPQGFEPLSSDRTFNLVPGFECLPLVATFQPGKEIRIELSAEG